MINRILVIIVTCLVISSCTGAGKFYRNTDFFTWNTYVDDLGTGSSATPTASIITSDGTAEVTLIKAADPPDNAASTRGYPFSGIIFNFNKSSKPVDLSNFNKILLTYKLAGQISFLLSQADIPLGEEYRVELPVAESYTELDLSWEKFTQPVWVKTPKPLDRKKITAVKFQVTATEKTKTSFGMSSFKLL